MKFLATSVMILAVVAEQQVAAHYHWLCRSNTSFGLCYSGIQDVCPGSGSTCNLVGKNCAYCVDDSFPNEKMNDGALKTMDICIRSDPTMKAITVRT